MLWAAAGSCPSAYWATDGASYPVPLLRRTGVVQSFAFALLTCKLTVRASLSVQVTAAVDGHHRETTWPEHSTAATP